MIPSEYIEVEYPVIYYPLFFFFFFSSINQVIHLPFTLGNSQKIAVTQLH